MTAIRTGLRLRGDVSTILRKSSCPHCASSSTYVSEFTQIFLRQWGVYHRVSTAYNPHSNLRAESAVKTIKRLIADKIGPNGSLDNNLLAVALLLYRNTPDRDTGRSPANIIFARQLKDALPTDPSKLKIRAEWLFTAEMREKALAKRHLSCKTKLKSPSKNLKPLNVGDTVQVQNQRGNNANKWDYSGTVVEKLDFDAFNIKMNGSGRITKRNRRFLRPIIPFINDKKQVDANINSGQSADEAGRPRSDQLQATGLQQTAAAKSTTVQLSEQDSAKHNVQKSVHNNHDQTVRMTDQEFDKGLSRAVRNVLNVRDIPQSVSKNPHQNKGTGPGRALPCPRDLSPPISPTKARTKRVKFATKRYIAQC